MEMEINEKPSLSMNIVNAEDGIGMNVNSGGGTKDHSKLKNLEYENSGHTGFQKEINSNNKIASDLINDTNSNNKFVTNQEKQTWNNKSNFSGDYNDLTNKPNLSNYATKDDVEITIAGETFYTNQTWADFLLQSLQGAFEDIWGDLSNKYQKPSSGIPKNDLDTYVQASLDKADTALQEHQDISGKQNIQEDTLTTTNKTIPTAINEVNSIAKGANQALSYINYSSMVTAINLLNNDKLNVGQNVMIVTVEVPDLWVSGIEATSSTYTYVDDETIVNELKTNGYIQVGYYKLSMLETQKVDLTNYVQNTDYASSSAGGIFKTSGSYATSLSPSGVLYANTKTYDNYIDASNSMFIGKGTLENVITGKGLVSNTDYANNSTGGVLMTSNSYATNMVNGYLSSQPKTYEEYTSASVNMFVSKGTLENVITGKELINETTFNNSQAEQDEKIDKNSMVYNTLPKVTGTGTSITLEGTSETPMKLELEPNTSQGDNPTPSSPQDIHVVTGNNTITISNSDNSKSYNLPLTLGDIEYCKIGDYKDKIFKTTGKNLFNGDVNTYTFTANEAEQKILGELYLVAGTTYYYSYTVETATTSSTRNTPYIRLGSTATYENTATNYNASKGRKIWQFTPSTTGTYFIGYWCHTPNVNVTIDNFMISTSNDITYEPYGNGQWYLKKNIGKVVLDGSEENWGRATSSNTTRFIINIATILGNSLLHSNYFIGEAGTGHLFTDGYLNNPSSGNISFCKLDITTLNDWTSWLSTHNTIVYYVLEIPTYTLLNDTLQEQLDNIYNCTAYQEETNISQTNADLPFVIDATGVADLNALIGDVETILNTLNVGSGV